MSSDKWYRFISEKQLHYAALLCVLAFVLGKDLAYGRFLTLYVILLFTCVFLIIFYENAVLYVLPIAFILPNRGVDIPGPFAVLMWDLFTVAFVGGVLMRKLIKREPVLLIDAKFRKALFLFVIIAAISLVTGRIQSPQTLMFGIKELIRLVELVMVLVALTSILTTKDRIYLLVRNLIMASAISLAFAFVGNYLVPHLYYPIINVTEQYVLLGTYRLRIASTAGNVAETGIYYLMMLGITAHWIHTGKNQLIRLFAVVLSVGFVLAIVFSYNKGTWQAAVFGTLVIMFYTKTRMKVFLIILLLFMFIALIPVFQETLDEQISIIATDLSKVFVSSGTVRIMRWLAIPNVLAKHPLLGVGYNCFAFVYGDYAYSEMAKVSYGHPHNMYVDIIAGTGLLGIAIFLFLGLRLLKLSKINIKTIEDPKLRSLSYFLHLSAWFFIAANMTASFLFKPVHPAYLLVTIFAIILSISRMQNIQMAEDGNQDESPKSES